MSGLVAKFAVAASADILSIEQSFTKGKENLHVDANESFFLSFSLGFILLDRLENVDISFDCYSLGFDSCLPRLRSPGNA